MRARDWANAMPAHRRAARADPHMMLDHGGTGFGQNGEQNEALTRHVEQSDRLPADPGDETGGSAARMDEISDTGVAKLAALKRAS